MPTSTSPVIVYIHGLSNKPPRAIKEEWCTHALAEGLKRNCSQSIGVPMALSYWADLRYEAPDDVEAMEERYEALAGEGAFARYVREGSLKDRLLNLNKKWGGRVLDKAKDLVGLDTNVEKLLGVVLADLSAYYTDADLRGKIRRRLSDVLEQQEGKPTMMIAHSMGSIVAYDVLRAAEADPSLQVAHLITIGSPLGLPLVTANIRQEFNGARTPENVLRWTNIADPGDKVALDCNLSDDFKPNTAGVRVHDVLVHNNYVGRRGESNRHKSYGYLRTPELCELVNEFLTAKTGSG